MINLLSPQSQSRVQKEYWIRVLSVWALLVSGVCIVTVLLLLPSYVLLSSELDALELELTNRSETEQAFKEAKNVIQASNAFIDQLNTEIPLATVTDIVKTVDGVRGPEIELRRYAIDRTVEDEKTIQVQGTASSREALANFKSKLEREALFESATVPISDLAREKDLPFVLTLTIAAIRR